MEFLEKSYASECASCGDRNFRKAESWIRGLTHYSLIGHSYLSANQVKHIFEQIQSEEINECKCSCDLCNHCEVKEND
jgi:hypothetical protein